MSKKGKKSGGSFIKQAAILAGAGILVRVVGFLYRLPLTNMIGNEGNGIYGAGYNIYNFFLIMSSAGLPVAISKMISEKVALGEYTNAKKVFRVSMTVSGTLSFLCAMLMICGAYAVGQYCELIGSTDSMWYLSIGCIYTLAPTVFIVGIMAVFRGFFQGLHTTVPTAMSQLIEQIFHAVFSILLAYLFLDMGVKYAAAGGTAGTGIGAFAGLVLLVGVFYATKKQRDAEFSLDKGDYRVQSFKEITVSLVKIAVPIITGTAIFSMTNLVDMIMVNSRLAAAGFAPDKIIDLYGQLNGKYVTLTTLPVAISTAIATAVIPSIAASVVRKEKEIVQSKVDTTLRITMMISIPAAAGLGALGTPILAMLFPNYPEGGTLLQVGSLSVIFLSLSQISTGVLQGIGKVKTPAFNALIGALTKIPFTYILVAIPFINVIGAVLSTTICYIVCSLLNFRALIKATGVKPDFVGMLVKPGIASIVMAIACILVYKGIYLIAPHNTIATLFAIIAALAVYFIIMVLIRGLNREDLQLMPGGSRLIPVLEKMNRL